MGKWYCDIIKSKSGLCPRLLAQNFQNHWNFQTKGNLCCANEVTPAPLSSFRMGTDQFSNHLTSKEKAWGWRLNLITWLMVSIKHVYVMKPWYYFKNKKLGTLRLGRMTCPDCTRGGHRSSESSLLLDPALCISSIWLFLSCVLYHKTVVSRTAFQWVQELFHRIIKTEERGVMGNPKSVAKLDNSVGILGSPLAAGDKIKAV